MTSERVAGLKAIADELAKSFWRVHFRELIDAGLTRETFYARGIYKALRKAKADGVREAAQRAYKLDHYYLAAELEQLADAIERGRA